jgi:hypothetical protein
MMAGILMMALDLEHHPENASAYAVELQAHTIPTTATPALEGMENRLLRIVNARRVPNAYVPKEFNYITACETQEMIRKRGSLPSNTFLVRVILRSQHNPRLFSLSCQWIPEKLVRALTARMPWLSTLESHIE